MRLMSIESDLPEEGTLGRQYGAVALDALATMWRFKWLFVAFAACGLAAGLGTFLVSGSRYTADGLIQLDSNLDSGNPAAKGPPRTTIDGALIVEGEARIIRSRPFVRKVVQNLQLDKLPEFQPARSALLRFADMLGLPAGQVAPEAMSPVDQAATEVMRWLSVTNDIRSYLINVSFTARNPDLAARVANGFVEEYLKSKALQRLLDSEAAARAEIAELSITFGDKHPRITRAIANLAETKARRIEEQQNQSSNAEFRYVGEGLAQAPAIAIPSGPRLPIALAIGLGGGIVAAIMLIMLLERRDRGFRTDTPVLQETGVRCLAMLPRVDRRRTDTATATGLAEAIRMTCLSIGLIGDKRPVRSTTTPTNGRVILVTSAVPGEGKSFLVAALSRFLIEEGNRVLTLDMSPRARGEQLPELEHLLSDSNRLDMFIEESQTGSLSQLGRTSGLKDSQRIFASPDFQSLIQQARKSYDFIIIEAPALLLLSDAVFLGRRADVVLHAAKWGSTPRRAVKAAVQRLRDLAVHVDGVILTQVNLRQHIGYATDDSCHYIRKYRRFYERAA
ncbi:MAG: hypothetical protein IT562_06005 [Alphaproteobacteria bacterium]|nr:hypothetical protein [Alphaproteobacteria bacterium]